MFVKRFRNYYFRLVSGIIGNDNIAVGGDTVESLGTDRLTHTHRRPDYNVA